MKIWVGVTDSDWFEFLRVRQPDEVNFWQPSGSRPFKVLQPGEPFLFKLHSPRNFIVGGGFFVRYTAIQCSIAWGAFAAKNGVVDLATFLARIRKYRRSEALELDPIIGCNILTEPFFWPEDRWIPAPAGWAANIVQGKSYQTNEATGDELWAAVSARLSDVSDRAQEIDRAPRYGADYLARARLGQGAFRILVTEAYQKRCAVTGEKTLPVLEASHIQPYAFAGPHRVSNGLLLRSDLHTLFDRGYLTVTPELAIEVSKRIKEEFENGKEYYAHHGRRLTNLPIQASEQPAPEFLKWHNRYVYEQPGIVPLLE